MRHPAPRLSTESHKSREFALKLDLPGPLPLSRAVLVLGFGTYRGRLSTGLEIKKQRVSLPGVQNQILAAVSDMLEEPVMRVKTVPPALSMPAADPAARKSAALCAFRRSSQKVRDRFCLIDARKARSSRTFTQPTATRKKAEARAKALT